jgi:hypothetical protein
MNEPIKLECSFLASLYSIVNVTLHAFGPSICCKENEVLWIQSWVLPINIEQSLKCSGYMIANLDLIIDITSTRTFSTLSKLKRWRLYSAIKIFFLFLSKLKRLRLSTVDSLCPNKAKLLCLVLTTFVYNFQFN